MTLYLFFIGCSNFKSLYFKLLWLAHLTCTIVLTSSTLKTIRAPSFKFGLLYIKHCSNLSYNSYWPFTTFYVSQNFFLLWPSIRKSRLSPLNSFLSNLLARVQYTGGLFSHFFTSQVFKIATIPLFVGGDALIYFLMQIYQTWFFHINNSILHSQLKLFKVD